MSVTVGFFALAVIGSLGVTMPAGELLTAPEVEDTGEFMEVNTGDPILNLLLTTEGCTVVLFAGTLVEATPTVLLLLKATGTDGFTFVVVVVSVMAAVGIALLVIAGGDGTTICFALFKDLAISASVKSSEFVMLTLTVLLLDTGIDPAV